MALNPVHAGADLTNWPYARRRSTPKALFADLKDGDAVLFENRTWHASGINPSGRPRIALMLQYGYRWLQPVDDPATDLLVDPALSPSEQQLVGMPDRNPDGSLAKGAGAALLRSWWHSTE